MPFITTDEVNMQNAYNSPLLDFVSNIEKVDKKTGDLYYFKKRKYLNLSFTFRTDSADKLQELTVRGSVHTFFNKGLHNANILSFKDFTKTLDIYSELFGLDFTKCLLKATEYGNNLFLDDFSNYNVDSIISNTHCVKRKMFNCNAGVETSLISGVNSTEVRVKFYSKSADYPKYCKNTLRIEDKLTKKRGINNKGIVFISDLYNLKNHISLLEKHLDNMSKIVLFDYTMSIPKNSKYIKEVREFSTKKYWQKLIKDCKENEVYDTKYNDKVALLNVLSEKYGTNILQKLIQQSKNQSLKALEVCDFSKFEIIKTPKNAPLKKPKNAQLYIRCIPYPYTVTCTSDIMSEKTVKKITKTCLVTGYNISMQRADSFLLSINGIRRLYYTDKPSFNIIKRKYLSKKWIDEDIETHFFEIYHNIRNTISNRKVKQKRLYPPHQLKLFEGHTFMT